MSADTARTVVDAAEVDHVLGTRLLRWLSAHHRVVDAVVASMCLAVQALVLVLQHGGQPLWPGLLSVLVSSVLLLWRRRRPGEILVAVALVSAMGVLLPGPDAPSALPAAVALYTVASSRPIATALLGYIIVVGLPASAVLVLLLTTEATQAPSVLDPPALVALALGWAVRGATQRREALTELVNERLATARVVERQRLSAEMHDIVAHSLSTMIALADGASTAWRQHPERSAVALDKLADVGRTALHDMNAVLQILRDDDAVLDEHLHRSGHNAPVLEDVVEVFRSTGVPVRLVRAGEAMPADPALSTTVYRIVQEALTNVLRYAEGATRVDVRIEVDGGTVAVQVVDDGRSDPQPTRGQRSGSGQGLVGIAERAAAYGGTSAAGPRSGGGWSTSAVLLIDRGARA